MRTQRQKAERFKALHEQAGTFVIPNPWDAGSARLLEGLGFEALASTSAGFAFSQGVADGELASDHVFALLGELAGATSLPVSADLENGFAREPVQAAKAIWRAAQAGAVGASIDDGVGAGSADVFDPALAAERVRAAVEVARSLPLPFLVTARAENFFLGRRDLGDTIRRLQAYQEAGADVLFAPGLDSLDDISTVLRSIDRPLNVLMGLPGCSLTVADLRNAGVKRISVGGSLARVAITAMLNAAQEIRDQGSFHQVRGAVSGKELNRRLRMRPPSP